MQRRELRLNAERGLVGIRGGDKCVRTDRGVEPPAETGRQAVACLGLQVSSEEKKVSGITSTLD